MESTKTKKKEAKIGTATFKMQQEMETIIDIMPKNRHDNDWTLNCGTTRRDAQIFK